MHGIYFGYLASLFFRFWVFLSCESAELCNIDRREAEYIVKSPEVSTVNYPVPGHFFSKWFPDNLLTANKVSTLPLESIILLLNNEL